MPTPETRSPTPSRAAADAARFDIAAGTGVLTFKVAPDFEAPQDSGADNVYDVRVRVTDSNGLFDEQDLAVTVTDLGGVLRVTTTADVVDGDTSSTEALLANRGADGLISLREAISAANANADHQTIELPAGTYTITLAGAGDNANAAGDFDILHDLDDHRRRRRPQPPSAAAPRTPCCTSWRARSPSPT